MKYCSQCGTELTDDTVFCTSCGYKVANDEDPANGGTAANEDPNTVFGQPIYETPAVNDKVGVGMCILSFLIPLVGLIYFFVKRKEKPNCAKTYGLIALISWIINFASTILQLI